MFKLKDVTCYVETADMTGLQMSNHLSACCYCPPALLRISVDEVDGSDI